MKLLLFLFASLSYIFLQAEETEVTFIAFHLTPTRHIAEFSKVLSQEKISHHIISLEAGTLTCQKENVPCYTSYDAWIPKGKSLKNMEICDQEKLIADIAQASSRSKMIVCTAGHLFTSSVVSYFKKHYPHLPLFIYYDNPEAYVPGEYSEGILQSMEAGADGIIFANASLEEESIYSSLNVPIDLKNTKKIGLGYFPLSEWHQLSDLREERKSLKKDFLAKHQIMDESAKLFFYLGGANSEYYNHAFPHFIQLLKESDLFSDNIIIALQQHPSSKREGNIDHDLFFNFKKSLKNQNITLLLSDISFDEACAMSDALLYYQTSANIKIALSGIPLAQVAHIPYPDILVRKKIIPVIQNTKDLQKFFLNFVDINKKGKEGELIKAIGYKETWPQRLIQFIRSEKS